MCIFISRVTLIKIANTPSLDRSAGLGTMTVQLRRRQSPPEGITDRQADRQADTHAHTRTHIIDPLYDDNLRGVRMKLCVVLHYV